MTPRPMIERVARLEANYQSLKEQQSVNHAQNRKSIHDLGGKLEATQGTIYSVKEEIKEDLASINVKLAKWSVVAGICTGVVTAVAIKLFEHAIK